MAVDPIKSDELTRRVLTELQRRFRLAGRGTVTRVEEELDLGPGYFKDQRRPGRKRFDLKILFRALDALEVEPAEFFASVLGTADPVAMFKAEAAVLRRRQRLPRILILEAVREQDEAPPEEGKMEPDLDALEALPPEDWEAVLRRTRLWVGRVPDSQLPRLLGIYASATLAAGRHDETQIVLASALHLAEKRQDDDQIGDLLLRAGHLTAARGEAKTAHALAERASLTFAKSGNLIAIGRSLVDQGSWLAALDRPAEALRALRAALRYFPAGGNGAEAKPDPAAERNRFSCLMSLAHLCRREGDLEAALGYLCQAGQSRGVDDPLVAKAVALRASIERQAGRREKAESLFGEAFQLFEPTAPLDAALCGVELVRVQLQQAKVAEARETAKAMLPLLEPLESNEKASDALAELLRAALAGSREDGQGLTTALLRRVARGLEAGRKRPRGRAKG